MATIYLRSSDGNDTDDGSTWALAKATYDAAAIAAGAGGLIYMDDDHRETFGGTHVFSGSGTYNNPLTVIVCVTDTTTPVTSPNSGTSTANLECTTGSDDIYIDGYAYFWGIYLKTSRSIRTGSSVGAIIAENSRLELSESSSLISTSSQDSCIIRMIDCAIASASIQAARGGSVEMRGCTLTGVGATDFIKFTTEQSNIILDGNDLSDHGGTNIVDLSGISSNNQNTYIQITNNLLPSGVTINAGLPIIGVLQHKVHIHGNSNADGYYQFYEADIGGDVTEETTVTRQGGATYDGTNLYSLCMTGNANSSYINPIRVKVASLIVDATTGATISVHIAYDKATTLNSSDIALEAKYHDATNEAYGKWEREIATTPQGAGDRTAFTDVSATETWNGTSGWTNVNEETIEATFTGGNGLVDVYLSLMSNETIYVCPKVEIS